MSTVGMFSTVVDNLLLFEYLHGTEHPHSVHDIPHMYHDIPTVLNIPTIFKISPTVIKISPTVLSTPHDTKHTLYRVIIHVFLKAVNPIQVDETF